MSKLAPNDPQFLVVTLFRNLSFSVELRDSHVKSRIWQKWGGVTSEMRWQNTVTSVLPALSCSVTRSLWWKWVAMQWATLWGGQRHKEQKMGRQTLDNTQQGTEALLPTTCKEQNPASRHMSPLGRSSSPRPALKWLQLQLIPWFSPCENPEPVHLTAPGFLTHNNWYNKCLLFEVATG